jgi:hypothetical protein
MDDPADHAAIVNALNTAHICWQMRLNPRPLLVGKPEQIPAHRSFPQNESTFVLSEPKD